MGVFLDCFFFNSLHCASHIKTFSNSAFPRFTWNATVLIDSHWEVGITGIRGHNMVIKRSLWYPRLTMFDVFIFSQFICLTSIRKMNDDVIKRKQFPLYWPFVRGIHRSPVNSPHAELWCFLDLRLSKRLGKQSWGWWFETPSPSLWRHCNVRQACK